MSWLFIIIPAAALLMLVFYFNRFITLKNRVKNEEGRISVEFERRAKLMNMLADVTVAGSDKEKQLQKELIELRGGLINGVIAERLKASEKADELMKVYLENVSKGGFSINAVGEAYPEYKSVDVLYSKMMTEWRDTEDRIAAAKGSYNAVVRETNTEIEKFPNNLFASMFGFHPYEFVVMAEADMKEAKTVTKEETEVKSMSEKQAEVDSKKK